jgi:uncharacterized iron-regulated membrane protein
LTTANLHHLLGFWISIPLAVVSLTGIYLGFPQQGREALASIAPMSPPQRGFAAAPMRSSALTPDAALAVALAAQPGSRPASINLPSGGPSATWRIQLRTENEPVTVLVDDRNSRAQVVRPLPGDRIAQWIRWIHDGSRGGTLWRTIVFLCGVFPPIFAVTGAIMWLKRRAGRKAMDSIRGVAPQAAE